MSDTTVGVLCYSVKSCYSVGFFETLLYFRGMYITLVWISKPFVSYLAKEAMSLLILIFVYCMCIFFSAVAVLTHLFVVCQNFFFLMSLSQGHVACWNFTLILMNDRDHFYDLWITEFNSHFSFSVMKENLVCLMQFFLNFFHSCSWFPCNCFV